MKNLALMTVFNTSRLNLWSKMTEPQKIPSKDFIGLSDSAGDGEF